MVSNTAMKNLCHYNEQCGKMSNNNTAKAENDANTVIPSTPMYVANTSNGNGGNMGVLGMTVLASLSALAVLLLLIFPHCSL